MSKLKNIANINMGQSPPSSTYNDNGIGLPFYQGKADFGFIHPVPRKYCSLPAKTAKKGDILISVRAPVGPVNIAETECCIGRGLAAITAKTFDQFFIYFSLIYQEEYIASLGTGSTFKAINKSQLETVNIPDFLLPEQRKIAYVLRTVQKAIEQQDKLIRTTTELKKALMQKLFTEGLPVTGRGVRFSNPEGSTTRKLKQTEIGPVPEDWEVVELGSCIEKYQYGLSEKGNDKGNVPILRMTNQKDGLITSSDLQYVNISMDMLNKFRVDFNDIIFNRTNSFELVGRTAIFKLSGNYVFASYLIRLKTIKEKLLPDFLNLYLNADETQLRLKKIATRGVSQSNISATRLASFIIPLPPLREQNQIVDILERIIMKISFHQKKKQTLTALFKTLLHELMTGQRRVHEIEFEALNADIKEMSTIL